MTYEEAIAEIEAHGINPSEFLQEMGYRETYAAADLEEFLEAIAAEQTGVAWLGY